MLQVVETSVSVITDSPSRSQDYTHPIDDTLPTYDMTPGFKPFTGLQESYHRLTIHPRFELRDFALYDGQYSYKHSFSKCDIKCLFHDSK